MANADFVVQLCFCESQVVCGACMTPKWFMENLVIEAHLVDCDQAWKEEREENLQGINRTVADVSAG